MDDGAKARSGFYLHTKSFSVAEVELLCKALKQRFKLDTTIQIHEKKYPVIYIKAESMEKFREIVTPNMHKTLLYKLK